jgi:hypothetical protein
MMWLGKGPDGTHHPWCSIMQPRGHLTCSCDTVSEVGHVDMGVTQVGEATMLSAVDGFDPGITVQVDSFHAIGRDGSEHGYMLISAPDLPAEARVVQIESAKRGLEAKMRAEGLWIDGLG